MSSSPHPSPYLLYVVITPSITLPAICLHHPIRHPTCYMSSSPHPSPYLHVIITNPSRYLLHVIIRHPTCYMSSSPHHPTCYMNCPAPEIKGVILIIPSQRCDWASGMDLACKTSHYSNLQSGFPREICSVCSLTHGKNNSQWNLMFDCLAYQQPHLIFVIE